MYIAPDQAAKLAQLCVALEMHNKGVLDDRDTYEKWLENNK